MHESPLLNNKEIKKLAQDAPDNLFLISNNKKIRNLQPYLVRSLQFLYLFLESIQENQCT